MMLYALYMLLFVLGANAIAYGLLYGLDLLGLFGTALCVFVVLRLKITATAKSQGG